MGRQPSSSRRGCGEIEAPYARMLTLIPRWFILRQGGHSVSTSSVRWSRGPGCHQSQSWSSTRFLRPPGVRLLHRDSQSPTRCRGTPRNRCSVAGIVQFTRTWRIRSTAPCHSVNVWVRPVKDREKLCAWLEVEVGVLGLPADLDAERLSAEFTQASRQHARVSPIRLAASILGQDDGFKHQAPGGCANQGPMYFAVNAKLRSYSGTLVGQPGLESGAKWSKFVGKYGSFGGQRGAYWIGLRGRFRTFG